MSENKSWGDTVVGWFIVKDEDQTKSSGSSSESDLTADELIAKSGKQFFVRPTAAQLMISENISEYQTRVDAKPPQNAGDYSVHSFNANFAEVWGNEATGMVRIPRFVAVTGGGAS